LLFEIKIERTGIEDISVISVRSEGKAFCHVMIGEVVQVSIHPDAEMNVIFLKNSSGIQTMPEESLEHCSCLTMRILPVLNLESRPVIQISAPNGDGVRVLGNGAVQVFHDTHTEPSFEVVTKSTGRRNRIERARVADEVAP
jgi:hypothetical protein